MSHPKYGPGYWDRRFAAGIGAGVGSQGKQGAAKAEWVNGLIAGQGVETVVDWGCGPGDFLGLIQAPRYVGVDVAPTAIAKAVVTHGYAPERSFVLWKPGCPVTVRADLALSLDVLYHLVDDAEYSEYLSALFGSADRLVAVVATNCTEEGTAPHVRHRVWLGDVPDGWRLVMSALNPHEPGGYLFRRA